MSTLVVDTLTNQEPQLCKAWVNFNGTGTVAIRASYNVSSITDNGVGNYTINFITAMQDTNYNTTGMTGGTLSSFVIRVPDTPIQLTTSQTIWTLSTSSTLQDHSFISVAVFR